MDDIYFVIYGLTQYTIQVGYGETFGQNEIEDEGAQENDNTRKTMVQEGSNAISNVEHA